MPFLFLDLPDENGVFNYRLEIVDKHPVLTNFLGKRFLVDTGSPISMTVNSEPFLLCGESFESSKLNIIDTVQDLSGLDVDGLIGLDVLSKFNVLVSYKDGFIKLSREAFHIPGQMVNMHVMPLKSAVTFEANLNGQRVRCILDTGAASANYVVSAKLVEGLESAGECEDFYPGVGRFRTTLYDMNFGEMNVPVKCGMLPSSLSALSRLISLMGQAVIGFDLLSQVNAVAINFRDKTMIIG